MKPFKKYLAACEKFNPTRWGCIRLANLADTLSEAEIRQALPLVHEIAVRRTGEQHARYASLNPPAIIMHGATQQLEKAKAGKSEIEVALRRSAKRRNFTL